MTTPLDSWIKSTKAADEAAKALVEKATPYEHLSLTRYEHGGGRWFNYHGGDDRKRELVADFYDEGNREFYTQARRIVPQLLAEKAVLLAMVEKLIEQRDGYLLKYMGGAPIALCSVVERLNAALESLIADQSPRDAKERT